MSEMEGVLGPPPEKYLKNRFIIVLFLTNLDDKICLTDSVFP